MSFKLGLTGSIGMGKSTTAQMFADLGCPVWDADAAVHRLYGIDGDATLAISDIWPEAVIDGMVSRDELRAIIAKDHTALPRIEAIVHPLVQADRTKFISQHIDNICVFDIPLLFETGGESEMDAVACVSVSSQIQRDRVLARGTMTAADLDRILARQMPNEEKCARSTYVIETDSLEHAKAQVAAVVADIKRQLANA
ncbi:dephospho-CoA kinase [Pelagimonas varians]|uniref:Dephospho-CoA kinase n=1 Tax=Pelagimonas varians TaxID=696760 RepID=A0A238L300_9RHOB|nr:dephospho-CoA kinase [Pelagimonas varians]PYG26546.1 dephospho-CoA kinase [Pelagimonas varians]SMX49357.1 Dephospho-CoA kinase [Pelagimonas varians]